VASPLVRGANLWSFWSAGACSRFFARQLAAGPRPRTSVHHVRFVASSFSAALPSTSSEADTLVYCGRQARACFSNRVRKAVTLGVSQDRLDSLGRDFKLFGDFGGADAIIEVFNDGVDRHPCTTQNRGAALHSRLHLDKRAVGPVNFLQGRHCNLPTNLIPCFHPKSPSGAISAAGGLKFNATKLPSPPN